jgi:hypothetical protein
MDLQTTGLGLDLDILSAPHQRRGRQQAGRQGLTVIRRPAQTPADNQVDSV